MRIAVIPGDGIGPEVIDAALGVLRAAANAFGLPLDIDRLPWSADYYLQTNVTLPPNGYDYLREFDAILLSHMLEHIVPEEQEKILTLYLPFLKENGLVAILVPQEAGYRSDPTHVTFMDHEKMEELGHKFSLRRVASYSFPFPRWVGMYFRHNESVMLLRK